MRTEPSPGTQPITSGFSSASAANSYSTTEHCLLSHRTPIATKVECCTLARDCTYSAAAGKYVIHDQVPVPLPILRVRGPRSNWKSSRSTPVSSEQKSARFFCVIVSNHDG